MNYESNRKVFCVHKNCSKRAVFRLLPSPKRLSVEPVCRMHLEYHAIEGDRVEPLVGEFKTKPIKAERPDDLKQFIGKTLLMMPEPGTNHRESVTVETIKGSVFKQSRFEINGMHHIVMLDAYKQLHNDESITQEDIDAFDEMIVESVERILPADVISIQDAPKFKKE